LIRTGFSPQTMDHRGNHGPLSWTMQLADNSALETTLSRPIRAWRSLPPRVEQLAGRTRSCARYALRQCDLQRSWHRPSRPASIAHRAGQALDDLRFQWVGSITVNALEGARTSRGAQLVQALRLLLLFCVSVDRVHPRQIFSCRTGYNLFNVIPVQRHGRLGAIE